MLAASAPNAAVVSQTKDNNKTTKQKLPDNHAGAMNLEKHIQKKQKSKKKSAPIKNESDVIHGFLRPTGKAFQADNYKLCNADTLRKQLKHTFNLTYKTKPKDAPTVSARATRSSTRHNSG